MLDLHDHLLRDLEALLFAAGRPLPEKALLAALACHGPICPGELDDLLGELATAYPVDGPRGFELARLAEGWTFRTNRLSERALAGLFNSTDETKLSPAALETLAIVAYAQPVSRPQIAEVRGVSSDSAVQTLVDRELIAEVGRSDGPGGAVLYGTTERFYVLFGLEGLAALPALEEFEVGEDEREELRRKLGLSVPE